MKKIYTIIILTFMVGNAKSQTQFNYNYLDINNVKACFSADGINFYSTNQANQLFYEVPINSGKQTLFSNSLWIGGYDAGGQLKISAGTYRQMGYDFYPGPIDTTGTYGSAFDSTWNRVWKVKQCDIDAYSSWYAAGHVGANPLINDSVALEAITNWPAFNMYGQPLASFTDNNTDGAYNIADGDVPLIKGDEAIFFVFNDAEAPHTETTGMPLGIEIQGLAYAHSCPNDSALYNTLFTSYKITNKGPNPLDSAFIGNWSDIDLGFPGDDYMGTDVTRGAYYIYNGDSIDGSGQPSAYGIHPPSQGIVFLKGPLAIANGMDDPATATASGTGYGDMIADNERLGMTKSMYYNNNFSSINGNPQTSDDYYQYLTGVWKNAQHLTYGADGTTAATNCDFVFPGTSDPTNFGTGGVPTLFWDESNSGRFPGDRRGLASSGPFTLSAHQTQTIDFAFVFGRDYTALGNQAGVTKMQTRIDSVKSKFYTGSTGCGCPSSAGVNELGMKNYELGIYPNPSSNNLTINYTSASKNYTITIYNAMGGLVKTMICKNASTIISIEELSSGIYLLNVIDSSASSLTGNTSSVKRFVKE